MTPEAIVFQKNKIKSKNYIPTGWFSICPANKFQVFPSSFLPPPKNKNIPQLPGKGHCKCSFQVKMFVSKLLKVFIFVGFCSSSGLAETCLKINFLLFLIKTFYRKNSNYTPTASSIKSRGISWVNNSCIKPTIHCESNANVIVPPSLLLLSRGLHNIKKTPRRCNLKCKPSSCASKATLQLHFTFYH